MSRKMIAEMTVVSPRMTIIVANTAVPPADARLTATVLPMVSSTAAGAKWGAEMMPL